MSLGKAGGMKEAEMKTQLALTQKALDIVMAIDHVRDTSWARGNFPNRA